MMKQVGIEATEHHELVLEVESELRGLRKALDIMRSPSPWPSSGRQMPIGCDAMALHICWLGHERLRVEIERFEQVLDEITEDDEE